MLAWSFESGFATENVSILLRMSEKLSECPNAAAQRSRSPIRCCAKM
jgi:hypothetical protein